MASVGRAAAAAILGALAGAAFAALFYAWHPAFTIEFDRDYPRNVSGIYGPERDEASGTTFAWTSQDAVVRLPGLDRRVPWTLTLRVRGGQADAWFAPGFDATSLIDARGLTRLLLWPLYQQLEADHPGLLDQPVGAWLATWRQDQRGSLTVSELLKAGKPVSTATSQPYGCFVKY